MADQETKGLESGIERSKNLVFKYANSLNFLPSPWDIKLVFADAELDIVSNQTVSTPHTGITLSWPQAKTALLFLRINTEIHEKEHGEIVIPRIAFSSAVQEKIPEGATVTIEDALRAINQVIAETQYNKEQEK